MSHYHYCSCGKSCICHNESCTNEDICPDCERSREDNSVSPCCEKNLEKQKAIDASLADAHARDGRIWECPDCASLFEHVCDEGEGCCWILKEKPRSTLR